MSEWNENTGEVPEEVTEETPVRVIYRCGVEVVWNPCLGLLNNDTPDLWVLDGVACDVLFYRVEED